MRILLLVLVGLVLLIIVLMFTNFGKNPSRKSGKMLQRELDLHRKRLMSMSSGSPKHSKAIEEMEVVAKELARREKEQAVQRHEPQHASPASEKLRQIAEDGYREAAAKAKAQGKTDRQTHESALVGALFKRLLEEPDAPPVTEEVVGALAMEILPFNVLPTDEGYKAIIEYVVWREHPEQANAEMVKNAVRAGIETMLEKGGSDIVGNLRKGPFAWNSLLI